MQILSLLILLFMTFSTSNIVTSPSVFSDLPLRNLDFVKLTEAQGGASNHNYFLRTRNQKIFLRVSENPAALAEEAATAQLVSDAGFSPPVVSYSPENLILATKMIENLQDFSLHQPETMEKAAELIRNLHESDVVFTSTRSPQELVEALILEAKHLGVALPEGLESELRAVFQRIAPGKICPCHLDLHKGNFLLDPERLWIIDWEYAANSDPLFDLAVLSATENFSDEEMAQLLNSYGKPEQFEQLYNYRMIADARWAIWCLVRGVDSTINFPFESEANRYYNAFQKRWKAQLLI